EADFVWREQKLIVELDSATYHSGPGVFHRDHEKDLVFRGAGYDVMRPTRAHVVRRTPRARPNRPGPSVGPLVPVTWVPPARTLSSAALGDSPVKRSNTARWPRGLHPSEDRARWSGAASSSSWSS
ncbi:MAG: DUF559 domain-containing protein, partial [Solirubrobacteraceae bacterium]